jgi:aminocarboxymuconate-semialdehyde decarboxylase
MKIDIFTHVMLSRYRQALYKYADRFPMERAIQDKRPALWDNRVRLAKLEAFDGLVQILTTTIPPVEEVVAPEEAAELAKICNDEMAELVAKLPNKYVAAVANVPLNNTEIALNEAERAIKQLGFKGIQIYTRVNSKPPSTEEMMPLYRLMADVDLPIWLHPRRTASQPDWASEKMSSNQIFSIFGWPYDTTAAMVSLVFAGIFEKFPTIKFVTHHLGGMVPYFADRATALWNNGLELLGADHFPGLTKHPIEYLKMFYADTALHGNSNYALECGLAFFGEDQLLFATDMPFGGDNGAVSIRGTISGIDKMAISDDTRKKIYEGNARRLLHL